MTVAAGAGGGPLRSESARQLTPEIRQSKFPGTPRPGVTLALAAPDPPVQLRWTTLRVQGPTLRDGCGLSQGRRRRFPRDPSSYGSLSLRCKPGDAALLVARPREFLLARANFENSPSVYEADLCHISPGGTRYRAKRSMD